MKECKNGTQMKILTKSASCYSFHFMKRYPYKKKKPWMLLGKKHQIVHDHYSLWNLKTIGSSMEDQLFKVRPRGNGGSLVSFAFWSSTSTMSMLRLSKVLAIFTVTSFSSPWMVSRLIKSVEGNEELSDGMSNFGLFFYFSRKLTILFCLFSSRNLCLSCLSSLYPTPNLSFF